MVTRGSSVGGKNYELRKSQGNTFITRGRTISFDDSRSKRVLANTKPEQGLRDKLRLLQYQKDQLVKERDQSIAERDEALQHESAALERCDVLKKRRKTAKKQRDWAMKELNKVVSEGINFTLPKIFPDSLRESGHVKARSEEDLESMKRHSHYLNQLRSIEFEKEQRKAMVDVVESHELFEASFEMLDESLSIMKEIIDMTDKLKDSSVDFTKQLKSAISVS